MHHSHPGAPNPGEPNPGEPNPGARWLQGRGPGQLCHRREGGTVHRAIAGAATLLVSKKNAERAAAQPHVTSDDGGGDDAGQEGEEQEELEVCALWFCTRQIVWSPSRVRACYEYAKTGRGSEKAVSLSL